MNMNNQTKTICAHQHAPKNPSSAAWLLSVAPEGVHGGNGWPCKANQWLCQNLALSSFSYFSWISELFMNYWVDSIIPPMANGSFVVHVQSHSTRLFVEISGDMGPARIPAPGGNNSSYLVSCDILGRCVSLHPRSLYRPVSAAIEHKPKKNLD